MVARFPNRVRLTKTCCNVTPTLTATGRSGSEPHDTGTQATAGRLTLSAGLGCSPFAHHYLGNRLLLSIPLGTEMFQFASGSPRTAYGFSIRR